MDTIKLLFERQEELFQGLAIHEQWNWSVKHPVVRLSFDAKYNEPGDVDRDVLNQLAWIAELSQIDLSSVTQSGTGQFRGLLRRLHHKTGNTVVVLVDEYDKPILDVLDNPEMAKANRDYLRGLYGVIKGSAENVRFVFVTGISMFSRASLFSGLNNLEDISLNPRYASICGYTDEDIDSVFTPEIVGLERENIRYWYNGYYGRGEERVYNPFGVLLMFKSRSFEPHWFRTGSPTFLFQLLVEKEVSLIELENLVAGQELVSKFDIDDISVEALLFQTGYLTIAEEVQESFKTFFRLEYPNFEVRQSLNDELMGYLGKPSKQVFDQSHEFCTLLKANKFSEFGERLRVFLSGILYPWHSSVGRYEAWYAGMLYSCFRTIDIDLRVEESSSHGRSDMVVFHGGQVFVMEFKVVEDESAVQAAMEEALEQMRERGYGDKYQDRREPVHLLGLVFGRGERTLLKIQSEHA